MVRFCIEQASSLETWVELRLQFMVWRGLQKTTAQTTGLSDPNATLIGTCIYMWWRCKLISYLECMSYHTHDSSNLHRMMTWHSNCDITKYRGCSKYVRKFHCNSFIIYSKICLCGQQKPSNYPPVARGTGCVAGARGAEVSKDAGAEGVLKTHLLGQRTGWQVGHWQHVHLWGQQNTSISEYIELPALQLQNILVQYLILTK